jgi:eukaryotic-like serine/threonine-protein kinase
MVPERVGKYILEERVAVGGMAEIFRAHTAPDADDLERTIAIKRLHPHLAADADFVKMLVNEAKLAVRLNHKNICQIFDLERHGDGYFIVMEYIHGRTLGRLIDKYKAQGQLMPLPLALFITQELCSGLSYAHRRRDGQGKPLEIIHRDISPQNVLLTFEGEVKVIDFGIAKASMHASSSDAGQIKGKFQYMSPEQARGDKVDQRTDVFSVGAILYEMLTGQMLYDEPEEGRLMQLARRGQFQPITAHRGDIPAEIEKLVMKALARDLNQRFQTAQQMQLAASQLMFSIGEPCDELQLSLLMRQLFEESASAGHSVMFDLDQRPSSEHDAPRRRPLPASENSLIADLHAMGLELDQSPPSEDLPVFLPNAQGVVISGEGVGEGIDTFSATMPVMSVPNLADFAALRAKPPSGEGIDAHDLDPTAMTILDIQAPTTDMLRSQRGGGPSGALQRAALPDLPTAPNLDVDTGYSTATRTDISVPNIPIRRPVAPQDPLKRWTIIAAVIMFLLLIALAITVLTR